MLKKREYSKLLNIKSMITIALLGAIASLLMSFEISVPFMPVFIKMEISEVPIMIGGLMFGFLGGLSVAFIKIILKLMFAGTTTMFIGEFVNLLCSLIYLMPCLIVMKYIKQKNKLMIGLLLSTVICSIVVVLMNYFITFPVYCDLLNMTPEMILNMFKDMNIFVSDTLTMMLFALIPFNLIKYTINSIITYQVSKRIKLYDI